MAIIYDFKTRKPVRNDSATLEIIGLNDPLLSDTITNTGRVLIDGLVPLALALELKALCDNFNARVAQ